MAFSFSRLILDDANVQMFERGNAYFLEGAVQGKPVGTAAYRATVSGTEHYAVALGFRRTGEPKYSCSCPYFQKHGTVCKHIMATALEWDASRNVPGPNRDDVAFLCGKNGQPLLPKK